MLKQLFVLSACLIDFLSFSQTYQSYQISDDIQIIKISENAFVHVPYHDSPQFGRFGSNGLIFTNDADALLFDTPMTNELTQVLVSWIIDSLNLNIVGFIPNHWHDDCMGDLEYLHSLGIESYANQLTRDIADSQDLPTTKHGFTDSTQFKLGNTLIACYYLGAAHSLDNIVVWIPSEQILFAGCMIKSLQSRGLGNTVDGDLLAYPKTIEKLIEKFPTAKIVVPGHGEFGGANLLNHTLNLAN